MPICPAPTTPTVSMALASVTRDRRDGVPKVGSATREVGVLRTRGRGRLRSMVESAGVPM